MPKPFIRTLNAIRSAKNPRGQDIAEAIDDLSSAISQLLSVVAPSAAPVATKPTQATGASSAQANAGPGKTLGQPTGAGSNVPKTNYISQILTSSPNGPIVGPYSSLVVATADSDLTTDPVGSVLTADGAGNVTGQSYTYLFGLPSYSTGIDNSPSLVIAGAFQYAAGKYEEDFWMIQDAIGSGINGSSTLEILHAGTSGPLSVLLGLDPFTAQVANSPSLVIAGSYEASSSGPAFAEDSWSIQDVIGSGVNGSSTLTFTHNGSSGAAYVSFPNALGILVNGQLLGSGPSIINLLTQVTGILPPANGGTMNNNVPGSGQYVGIPWDIFTQMTSPTSATISNVDYVYWVTFVLTEQITFTKVTSYCSAVSSGVKWYMGIYSGAPAAANTSLLVQWTYTSPASAGVVTATVSKTTLTPGVYTLAFAGSSTAGMDIYGLATGVQFGEVFNENTARCGDTYQGGAVTTLPNTINTISSSQGQTNPFVLLEP